MTETFITGNPHRYTIAINVQIASRIIAEEDLIPFVCCPNPSSATPLQMRELSVTMTGHIYRDVILEHDIRLFRGAMGAEFLFMDNNARPHRANIVDECLQSEDITRMY
ncbi:transposable element Tcb1 transposase [Trichonephila clavipes]|nr:transposable element Tcb1 transposase [Trichonephila clavipes]